MQLQRRTARRDEGVVEELFRHQSGPAAIAIADGDIRSEAIERHRFVRGMNAQVDALVAELQRAVQAERVGEPA